MNINLDLKVTIDPKAINLNKDWVIEFDFNFSYWDDAYTLAYEAQRFIQCNYPETQESFELEKMPSNGVTYRFTFNKKEWTTTSLDHIIILCSNYEEIVIAAMEEYLDLGQVVFLLEWGYTGFTKDELIENWLDDCNVPDLIRVCLDRDKVFANFHLDSGLTKISEDLYLQWANQHTSQTSHLSQRLIGVTSL